MNVLDEVIDYHSQEMNELFATIRIGCNKNLSTKSIENQRYSEKRSVATRTSVKYWGWVSERCKITEKADTSRTIK